MIKSAVVGINCHHLTLSYPLHHHHLHQHTSQYDLLLESPSLKKSNLIQISPNLVPLKIAIHWLK